MKRMVWLAVVVLVGCAGVFAADNKKKTTVTIKDIDSISQAGVWLFEELPVGSTNTATALGTNTIKNNILTVDLTFTNKAKGKLWQGAGDFYIAFAPIVKNSSLQPLVYVGNGSKPIKYSFNNDELVTFSFSEFKLFSYSEFVSDTVTNMVTNEAELAKIQGSWKHTNRQAQGATYTFSGNQFTFTVNDGRDPISGTIKIANNKLCLIVSDELFQVKYIDIKPNKSIFINQDALLMGNLDLYWGPFQKQ